MEKIYTDFGNGCIELSPEFKGNLIDAVEDFLESKGVTIDNPEKEDDEDPAIIYGSDRKTIRDFKWYENVTADS